MIIVEIPVKKMIDEIARLENVDGHFSELYAQGARDAMMWLIEGGDAPSAGKGFPLLFKKVA